jgi:hypothetical protein
MSFSPGSSSTAASVPVFTSGSSSASFPAFTPEAVAAAREEAAFRNRFRDPDFMYELVHNPVINGKAKDSSKPSYRLISVTIHGRAPAKSERPGAIRTKSNTMIILSSTGSFMGTRATTCATAYNNVLAHTFRGHPKVRGTSFGNAAPLPPPPPPNIVNMFAAFLGQDGVDRSSSFREPDIYDTLLYAPDGEKVPNRRFTLTREDLTTPYAVSSAFAMQYHFGIYEVDGFFFNKTVLTRMIEELIITAHGGNCDLNTLQDLIIARYNPQPNSPLIIYINSCDAVLRDLGVPPEDYIEASQRPTKFALTSVSHYPWPKAVHVPIVFGEPEERFKLPPGFIVPPGLPESVLEIRPPRLGEHITPNEIWASMGFESSNRAGASSSAALMNEGGESNRATASLSGQSSYSSSTAASSYEPMSYSSFTAAKPMNEEHTGGRLKKRKTYRRKRWSRSTSRRKTGSRRASRSSNRCSN